PVIGAVSDTGRIGRNVDALYLDASEPESGIRRGIEAVLTEEERVERHGFTAAEVERAKRDLLRGLEQTYSERDKAESSGFVDEYVEHFLSGAAIPGIAYEFDLAKRLLPAVTMQEVN